MKIKKRKEKLSPPLATFGNYNKGNAMKKVEALISSLRRLGFISLAQEIFEKVLKQRLPEDIVPPQFSWILNIVNYKDMDALDLFIQENWEQLQKIDSIAKGKYKRIGAGMEGTAFLIGDGDRVLKVQEEFQYNADPFYDSEKEIQDLFSGKSSPEQIMIYAHGEFTLPPDEEKQFENEILYWKIMEKVEVDEWQEDFHRELQSDIDLQILYLADELGPENIEESEEEEWEDSGEEFEHYTFLRRQAERLGSSDSKERKLLSKQIAERVKHSKPSTVAKIKTIQKGLPDDWLENYIETFLFELCVKGKEDFASGNFGRRSSTGKFVWFDS